MNTHPRTIPSLPGRLAKLCRAQGWQDAMSAAMAITMIASAWLVPPEQLGNVASWGLMIYGTVMAVVILAGVMVSSNDGELLGKTWSSIWIPLRTTVSTSLLLPVITVPYAMSSWQWMGLALRHLMG